MSEALPTLRAEPLRRFKRYPAYKDSGVEWLGEIPAHWEVKRLKYVAELNPPPVATRGMPLDTEVSFVPMEAVGEYGGLELSRTKALVDVGTGYTYFADGDVVVAKITPCFENGKGALAAGLTNGVAFGTTELHVLRSRKASDRAFLFYLTLSDAFRRLGEAEMYGAGGQKRVPEGFVENLKHPIPPKPEQRAIASFLDRETARIDALVAKKELLIELLQEKRTALITRAVTKGLDPTVPMKDSGVEWLGQIPAHWEVKALSRILLRITYGFTNPMPVADAGPYMLTALDIGDGRILYENARRTTDDAFEQLLTDKSKPTKGDLLLTKDGTLGRVAVADDQRICINQSVALLRFAPTTDVEFMQLMLRSAPYQERMIFEAGGTAIKHIYISRLARMPVAVPMIEEQRAIASFLDRETAKLDALVAKVRDAIDCLKELRTALISAAVTGKIDVREEAA